MLRIIHQIVFLAFVIHKLHSGSEERYKCPFIPLTPPFIIQISDRKSQVNLMFCRQVLYPKMIDLILFICGKFYKKYEYTSVT